MSANASPESLRRSASCNSLLQPPSPLSHQLSSTLPVDSSRPSLRFHDSGYGTLSQKSGADPGAASPRPNILQEQAILLSHNASESSTATEKVMPWLAKKNLLSSHGRRPLSGLPLPESIQNLPKSPEVETALPTPPANPPDPLLLGLLDDESFDTQGLKAGTSQKFSDSASVQFEPELEYATGEKLHSSGHFQALQAFLVWLGLPLVFLTLTILVTKRLCACEIAQIVHHTQALMLVLMIVIEDAFPVLLMFFCMIYLFSCMRLILVALFCRERLVLPLRIENYTVDAINDSGACNTMSEIVARDLGLQVIPQLSFVLPGVGRRPFPSRGYVTARVIVPGDSAEHLIRFFVLPGAGRDITLGIDFCERHNLEELTDPRYVWRSCNVAEAVRFELMMMLSSISSANMRKFLKVDIQLANGSVTPVQALLDTGAKFDAFSLAFVSEYFPEGGLQDYDEYITCVGPDNERIHIEHCITVDLLINGGKVKRNFLIVPGLRVKMILGQHFHLAHTPHGQMANLIVKKELQLAEEDCMALYHFPMQYVGPGSRFLLRESRRFTRQPVSLASEKIQQEIDGAERAELIQQNEASWRIREIEDRVARAEARRLEADRHARAWQDIQPLYVSMRTALAQENPAQMGEQTAGPAPALAPAHVPIPAATAPIPATTAPLPPSARAPATALPAVPAPYPAAVAAAVNGHAGMLDQNPQIKLTNGGLRRSKGTW